MLPFNERATHRSYKKRRSFAPIFYFNCEHFLFVYIIVKQKQKNCENARKVISVYTSFVLQYTVSGRLCKHKTDVTAWHRIHLSHKRLMKYSGHRKLLCELSKLSNLMLLTSSDTKRTLMHLFLFTNSAQRELV